MLYQKPLDSQDHSYRSRHSLHETIRTGVFFVLLGTYMMILCFGAMKEVTILWTPIFSSSFNPLVSDWNMPGTSRMLKYDRVGPDISTFNMSLEKFRIARLDGVVPFSGSCNEEGDISIILDA